MKVLIAVDDTPESMHAVDAAYRFFGPDADFHLISVGDRPPVFTGGYGAGAMPTAADLTRQLDAAMEAARHAVQEASSHLPGSASLEVESGHAGRVICESASEHEIDVIAIGSHERHFWERLIDPSVGRYLIDHAPCPVLVVR
ncbi:MAG: universal stress protein [Ilumatobacter sp.]|nr:universal stress protein [Ilumatobacter sp.]